MGVNPAITGTECVDVFPAQIEVGPVICVGAAIVEAFTTVTVKVVGEPPGQDVGETVICQVPGVVQFICGLGGLKVDPNKVPPPFIDHDKLLGGVEYAA